MSDDTTTADTDSTDTDGTDTDADAPDADDLFPYETTIDIAYDLNPKEHSFRTRKVSDSYGIDFDAGTLDVIDNVSVRLERGDILFATGASGAGKTSFCEALADELDAATFADISVPRDTAIIDVFPDDMTVNETQSYMGMFGLGEAHLNLRHYAELSQGQKYRAKLAYAAAEHDTIFADEFCATLDRVTATTIAYSVRRQLDKGRLDNTFIFATTHRDFLDDLKPDVLLDFDSNEVSLLDDEGDAHERVFQSAINTSRPEKLVMRDRETFGELAEHVDPDRD